MKWNPTIRLIAMMILLSSFTSTTERIEWNKWRPLQWSDFQGQPDYKDNFRDVVTASALKFTTRCVEENTMQIIVKAEFVKESSWVKEKARNDYHLGHERLHFDITELCARKFREQIEGRQFTCDDKPEVDSLVLETLDLCATLQNRYDKETFHSMDKNKQGNWEVFVANELIRLEDYAFSSN